MLACAAVACVALASQAHAAAAVPAGTPLPESDYTVRSLCGAPAPGYATCFAMELVPRTAAAKGRATPLGMTLSKPVKPASAADGTFGLRPQDLHSAYNLPSKAPLAQTIAIVDAYDDPTVEADLAVYDKELGLPECNEADGCFTKVNQDGQASPLPGYNSGWAGEIALDVETAHATCEEGCHIILVEAENSSDGSLEAAEQTAVRLGATEISNSFGGPEPAVEGSAFDHPGVAITASTGDYGYLNWDSLTVGFPNHPNYPASSPDVVAVGGTRLHLNSGSWEKETVWNDGSTLGDGAGAGGSGCSEYATAQVWQQNVSHWGEVGCGDKRAAADVSADGDPYSGVAVYRAGSWSTIGGTSLSSPIVAATFALAGGTGGVSYPAQTLYAGLGAGSLHDVVSGSNGKCENAFDEQTYSAGCTTHEEEESCAKALICRAAAGYDGPSGVGTPDGIGAFTPPPPTVRSLSVSEGDLGTAVTISGEDLKGVIAVKFGEAAATNVLEDSAGELTVTSPGHAPGEVDVTVTTAGGTSAISAADKFTYLPDPAIASVEPAAGPTAGGTSVTIKGERLSEERTVEFGGVAATGVVVKSDNELTATAPAHAEGEVDVTVRTPAGTSAQTTLDRFTYYAPPTVGAVTPNSGSIGGATTVTVRGEHLQGVESVKFADTDAARVVEDSPSELTVTTPAHAEGEVDVTVSTPGGTSAFSPADRFSYLKLPVIDEMQPTEGPVSGATTVTIKGEYLTGATAVKFGGSSGTGLDVRSASEITVESPPHGAEVLDVTVTTPVGTSETSTHDRFAYVGAPVEQSPPAIEGFPMQGRTLVERHGDWENDPTSYSYRWLRCESGGGCSPISGATRQTYLLTGEDVGDTIEVQESAGNAGGVASATSAGTGEVVVARVESVTWTGASAVSGGGGVYDWSTGADWEGGKAPTEVDIGTLSFPALSGNPACAAKPYGDACYLSTNDLKGVAVETLSIDDGHGYGIFGEAITLGSGGVRADTADTTSTMAPYIAVPMTLSADQKWSFTGAGIIGGEVIDAGGISGESHSLDLSVSNGYGLGFRPHPDSEVGPVTIEGTGSPHIGSQIGEDGYLYLSSPESLGEETAKVNADDGNPVRIEHASILGAGSTGPLTIENGDLTPGEPFPEPGDPFGTLTVEGPVTLEAESEVTFDLGPSGTTPGVDETQLNATGNVDLGESLLYIFGPPSCPHLPLGSVYTLVSSTGTVTGTFKNVPNGEKVILGFSCSSEKMQPTFEVNYTEHTVTATVVKPVPVNVIRPDIFGVPGVGGEVLEHAGGWYNEPTFAYQWLLCDSSGEACAEIPDATGIFYSPVKADLGHTLRLRVTATNVEGQAVQTSAPTAVVKYLLPVNLSPPQIVGEAREGHLLFAAEGLWEYEPTGYSFQWERCDASGQDCGDIGTNSNNYTVTSQDVGHTIKVKVTAANEAGEVAATSTPTGEVPAPPPPPTEYALTLITAGEGTVQCAIAGGGTFRACGGEYAAGVELTLKETPGPFYSFAGWSKATGSAKNCAGTAIECTFTITDPTAVEAPFSQNTHTLTVTPSSGGSVTASTGPISACSAAGGTCSGVYDEGRAVTLKEQPEPGYSFAGWSGGGCSGTADECTISSMSVSTTVSATWTVNTTTPPPTKEHKEEHTATTTTTTPQPDPPAPGTAQAGGLATVKGSTAEIKLTCTGAGACEGSLKLVVMVSEKRKVKGRVLKRTKETTIGEGGFSLGKGESATIHVHLTGKGQALVRKAGGGLRVKLTGSATATRTLVLREAKKKAKRARAATLTRDGFASLRAIL